MRREREAILSLVVLGRITPAEAERLLAVWNADREELWALAVVVVVGLAQYLPDLGRMAHAWMSGSLPGLLHAV